MKSIDNFIDGIEHCDILINNAGMMCPQREIVDFSDSPTVTTMERTFVTNYLGPVYLTMKLLPVMLKSAARNGVNAEVRIVNVGSRLEKNSSFSKQCASPLHRSLIDGQHNPVEEKYSMWTAYANSKLGNLLFTFELSRRLRSPDWLQSWKMADASIDESHLGHAHRITVNAGRLLVALNPDSCCF